MDPDEFVLTATEERLRALQEAIDFMSSRVEAPLRRRLITRPSGGGGGAKPYIITTEASSAPGDAIAFYRTCGEPEIKGRSAKGDGSPFTVDSDEDEIDLGVVAMGGVLFTGQVAMVSVVNGLKQIVGGWDKHLFRGTCSEAITDGDTGTVALGYVDYLDASRSADVTAWNTIGRNLEADSDVLVGFMSNGTGGESFVIIALLECPT